MVTLNLQLMFYPLQISVRESICEALSHYAGKGRTLDKSVYKVVSQLPNFSSLMELGYLERHL